MQESAKYLIHASFTASGVVERSDVVGAIFGQTEGLLGEELDLRTLQDSSKVGRIDVDLDSTEGAVSGTLTIASGLDRVETAVLAAGLETIERIGPCRAEFTVTELEDVRSAKRRAIVERAEELLADFEAEAMESRELVEAVRERSRVAALTEYEGLPAGPRVADSDAIVVVEGRADVRTLLRYGVKNAIAVEGTDVPDAVAALTAERTVTAFFDGDRGGELILRELRQVGDVDYATFAPTGRAVEDLDRETALASLRDKVPFAAVAEAESVLEAVQERSGTDTTSHPGVAGGNGAQVPTDQRPAALGDAEFEPEDDGATDTESADDTDEADDPVSPPSEGQPGSERPAGDGGSAAVASAEPATLGDHVAAVIGHGRGTVRVLDADRASVVEEPVERAIAAIETPETAPYAVVVDGPVTQKILDVAAQRGVGQVVGRETGEFVKQPTAVRVRTADSF